MLNWDNLPPFRTNGGMEMECQMFLEQLALGAEKDNERYSVAIAG